MTTYSIFSLYDKTADTYMKPFYEATYESAIRALTEALEDTTTAMYKHAAELELTHLGFWHEDEGRISLASPINEHESFFISKLIPAPSIVD